ncbi:MAG TPA: substrate-binding domain-containing protein [Anaerovoracaceae bacterium]|nr:substrate-binding domain-containing protein [Anaerovoracaceae bacterium]
MKKLLCVLLTVLMVASLTACTMDGGDNGATPAASPAADASAAVDAATGGETPAASPTAGEDQFYLGYAAPGLGSEYQMMVYDQMVAQCAERGIKLDVLSCEGDVSLQTQQVENFITMGVDAIIIYPADQAAVVDVLKQARSKGIRVVVNDADDTMDPEAYDVLMSASGFDMGDVACKLAAEWIDTTFPDAKPGTVKVAVFGFWLTDYFGQRCDVMMDIASYTDKAVVVESYNPGADNYTTMIPQYASILVQQHPDIACVLSFTDTFAIMVDEVFMQNNLDYSKIGQFTVDRTDECLNRIKGSVNNTSTIRGTAVPGLNIVSEVLDAAMGLDDGGKLNEKKQWSVEVLPVTAANVDELLK